MGHRLSNRACLDPIQLWCCCLIFYWKYVFGSASEFTHSLTSWLYVWSVPLMVRWMLTPHCPKAVEWGFKFFNLIFYEFPAKSFARKLLFHKYLQVNRFSSFNWKPFGIDRTRLLRSRQNLLPETDTTRLSLNEAVVMVVKLWISPCIHGTTILQSLRYNYPRSSV